MEHGAIASAPRLRRTRTQIMLDREAERREAAVLEFESFLTEQEQRIRYFVEERGRLCFEEDDAFLVGELDLEVRK